MRRLMVLLITAAMWMVCGAASAGNDRDDGSGRDRDHDRDRDRNGGLQLVSVSARPEMVSGGNVLVRVEGQGRAGVHVYLNRRDVSGAFQQQADGTLLGLVTGLGFGRSQLIAETSGRNGEQATLNLTNYPITGPIFSGPHESPFVCMTAQFPVPGSTTVMLGAALDSDCSIATRVDYVYRTSAATFAPLPAGNAYPQDLVQTTTTTGKTVNYIVRVETGTINRAIYQTAILHDPLKDPAPTPFAPPPSWNQRLVYTLGGGCVGGYYIQGKTVGNSGILEDLMLRQGYGVASSSLNVFGNNCQEVLAAESLMMVKERFIENFGPAAFTIGFGCSGGSEQAQPISDEFPGLLDGIVIGCSFPELTAGITLGITDADLFWHYLQGTTLTWTPAQQNAASGFPTVTTPASIGPGNAVRTKAQGGSCNAGIPV
ncbi:MAG TPA: DUF6351 family protein, partial [Burkholderiaceae bacterium]